MTFYLWVYMPWAPKFSPTDPKFYGEFESELRSGFRARNGALKGSGVSGTDGDNSPFRCARPKLISYFYSPYTISSYTHFLVHTGIFGPVYRFEHVSCRSSNPGRSRKMHMCTKKYVEWDFGYEESEYEFSVGLAPQNGELPPSDPETPEPFNSPFRARSPERNSDSNSPQNLGSVGQNLGSRAYIPRDKRSMVKLEFFFWLSRWQNWNFFDLSYIDWNHWRGYHLIEFRCYCRFAVSAIRWAANVDDTTNRPTCMHMHTLIYNPGPMKSQTNSYL